jgi:hypothetical protein
MRTPTPIYSQTQLERIRWQAFRNDSGESIPAFALLRPTGWTSVEGLPMLTMGKPNADSQEGLFLNSERSVDTGGFGTCTWDSPGNVAYTGSSPSNGQTWGGKSGSWLLNSGYGGWLVVGGSHTARGQNVVYAQRNTARSGIQFWCGEVSGQSVTTTSNTLVTIGSDSVYYKGAIWSLASSELTISATFNARIAMTTTFSPAGAADINCFAILQKYTGGVWDSDVYEVAKDWSHVRTQLIYTGGAASPSMTITSCVVSNVSVTSGEKYRVVSRKGAVGNSNFDVGVILDIQERP